MDRPSNQDRPSVGSGNQRVTVSAVPTNQRSRLIVAAFLLVVILLGLVTRRHKLLFPEFIATHAGDALWTVAAYLSIGFLFPQAAGTRLFATAIVASFVVECSQLIDNTWLDVIRQHSIGRLLLGNGFDWIDFLRYFVGAMTAITLDFFMIQSIPNYTRSIEANGPT